MPPIAEALKIKLFNELVIKKCMMSYDNKSVRYIGIVCSNINCNILEPFSLNKNYY